METGWPEWPSTTTEIEATRSQDVKYCLQGLALHCLTVSCPFQQDLGDALRNAIQAFRKRFKNQHKVEPKLWIDKYCSLEKQSVTGQDSIVISQIAPGHFGLSRASRTQISEALIRAISRTPWPLDLQNCIQVEFESDFFEFLLFACSNSKSAK